MISTSAKCAGPLENKVVKTKDAEQSIIREELDTPTLPTEDVINPNIDIVDFDGPDDPVNLLNWRSHYKWFMVAIISMMSLMVYVYISKEPVIYQFVFSTLGTIIVAPEAPQLIVDFYESCGLYSTVLVSIWELGEILGHLIIAPLAELYGKLVIYHIANILFIIFSIEGATSTNINILITFQWLLLRHLTMGQWVISLLQISVEVLYHL